MRSKVFTGLLAILLVGTLLIQMPQAVLTDPEEISVLVLLGNGFGWSFFEFRDILEAWGCDITITGSTSHIQSCLNRVDASLDADILISEIDREDVGQYDVLFVPAGGHWQGLMNTESALILMQMAYEEGLIVSGICIGVAPLAASNITEGKYVTGHNFCYSYVRDSGGTLLPYKRVVADGNIITGDNGNGVPIGFEYAPHYELCVAIMKKLFDYTYFESMTYQSQVGENETVYYLNVTTSGPIHLFGDVTTPEIEEVTVNLHTEGNRTIVESVNLTDDDNDTVFTGELAGFNPSDYVIDLEITDTNVSMEYVRDIQPTMIESTDTITTTTGPGNTLGPETIGIIGVGILVVIMVAIVGIRRFKS